MHILTFIIWFIIASIMYACKGDFSGIEVIGKVLLWIGIMAIVCIIMMNPALLIIAIIIFVIALVALCSK